MFQMDQPDGGKFIGDDSRCLILRAVDYDDIKPDGSLLADNRVQTLPDRSFRVITGDDDCYERLFWRVRQRIRRNHLGLVTTLASSFGRQNIVQGYWISKIDPNQLSAILSTE